MQIGTVVSKDSVAAVISLEDISRVILAAGTAVSLYFSNTTHTQDTPPDVWYVAKELTVSAVNVDKVEGYRIECERYQEYTDSTSYEILKNGVAVVSTSSTTSGWAAWDNNIYGSLAVGDVLTFRVKPSGESSGNQLVGFRNIRLKGHFKVYPDSALVVA